MRGNSREKRKEIQSFDQKMRQPGCGMVQKYPDINRDEIK